MVSKTVREKPTPGPSLKGGEKWLTGGRGMLDVES